MCAAESSISDAAVKRRCCTAWAYKKGFKVEPGWRWASTPSTSCAWLKLPDDPTQASTWPLALSSTSTAPSSTLCPCSSRRWRCRLCSATRCTSARSVVVMRLGRGCPGGHCASTRRAQCGAMPLLAGHRRALNTCSVRQRTAAQSGAGRCCKAARLCSTPQARCPTTGAVALGPRMRAAAMAASCPSNPCGALPNRVRLKASRPTNSPRKGTRLR